MRRFQVLVIAILATCLCAVTASAQSTQTPDKQEPAQKAVTPADAEKTKNEVELALEEAKKRDELVLAACIEGEKCESGSEAVDGKVVLVGRVLELAKPAYPPIARAAHVTGTVQVQLIIDKDGTVAVAAAISGHPLLQAAAVTAARNSRFSPTLYEGKPVKVTGVIQYNFVSQ
jgi:TonB family protein